MSGGTSRCPKTRNFAFRKAPFSMKNIQKNKNHTKQNHIAHRSKKIAAFISQKKQK